MVFKFSMMSPCLWPTGWKHTAFVDFRAASIALALFPLLLSVEQSKQVRVEEYRPGVFIHWTCRLRPVLVPMSSKPSTAFMISRILHARSWHSVIGCPTMPGGWEPLLWLGWLHDTTPCLWTPFSASLVWWQTLNLHKKGDVVRGEGRGINANWPMSVLHELVSGGWCAFNILSTWLASSVSNAGSKSGSKSLEMGLSFGSQK